MYTRKLINCLGGLNNNLNTISNTIGNIYTTGGNVGIGTTSPSSLLHVAGSLTASSIENVNLFSGNSTFSSLLCTNFTSNSATISNINSINTSVASLFVTNNSSASGTCTISNSIITNASSGLLSANNITSINYEPKIALTSASDGGYVVTASSNDFSPNWFDWKAFNKSADGEGWHSKSGYISVNFGSSFTFYYYTGDAFTILSDNLYYTGEWIQLQFPSNRNFTSMSITPRESFGYRAPRDFILVGSTTGDPVTWVKLIEQTGVIFENNGKSSKKTFTFQSTGNFNYYRLITGAISNPFPFYFDYLNIMEIEFYLDSESNFNNLTANNISAGNVSALNTVKTGSIFMWLTNTPPQGYLICNGAALSAESYSDLYNVIEYFYGGSAGIFNLPDLRGRVPVGNPYFDLGITGGSETHTLTINEMPLHQHSATTNEAGAHIHDLVLPTGPSNSGPFVGFSNRTPLGISSVGTYLNGEHNHTYTPSSIGGGQPHNNMQPYLVVNYIIKY